MLEVYEVPSDYPSDFRGEIIVSNGTRCAVISEGSLDDNYALLTIPIDVAKDTVDGLEPICTIRPDLEVGQLYQDQDITPTLNAVVMNQNSNVVYHCHMGRSRGEDKPIWLNTINNYTHDELPSGTYKILHLEF